MKVFNFLRGDLILFGLACFLTFINSSAGADYLKERPSILTPCKLKSSGGGCLAKGIETVINRMTDVIPGLPSYDPFQVKQVQIMQRNQNIDLKIALKDIAITGFSKSKVTKASIDDDYTMKFLMNIPLMHTKSKYRMKGSILLLNFNLTGIFDNDAYDLDVLFTLKSKLVSVENQKFFEITGIETRIQRITNTKIHFTSDTNAEIVNTINELFNQNWHDIYELVRPALEETLQKLALDRLKTIIHYVPATYLIEDLP